MKKIALLLAFCAAPVLAADDPLTRPIQTDNARRWMEPRAAIPILGGTWLTGALHLNTVVIDTGAGLIAVDSGMPQSVPVLEAQIRALGRRVTDVRYILVTEAHFDHAGGVAALARDSGAVVIGSPYTVAALAKGRTGPEDQQDKDLLGFPAVKRLRAIRDGGVVHLGTTSVTAHYTPGHTIGSTSWSWQACERGQCRSVSFMASLSPAAQEGWRFSAPEHGWVVANYRRGIRQAAGLPCDILITGHPEHGEADEKVALALQTPLKAPSPQIWLGKDQCRAAAGRFAARLDAVLAKEAAK